MAYIDDKKIKLLIRQYQSNGEKYEEILESLSEYIYNFPKLIYKADEDCCGDFYLYFFNKIKSVLQKYKIEEYKFTSWFTSVLKNHYLNWLKQNKKRNDEKNLIPIENIQNDIEYKMWVAKEKEIDHEIKSKDTKQEKVNEIEDKLQKALDSLPPKVRIVMKLHYFNFFSGQDLQKASELFDQDILILLNKYNNLLKLVPKQYEKEQENIDNINSNFYKITEAKEKLWQSEMKRTDKELLIRNIQKWEKKHEKYIKEYKKFYVTIDNNSISDFLGVKLNTLHNLIFRGKNILRKKLE